MKNFIKYAFATGVGVMIGSFLVVIILVGLIGAIIGVASQKRMVPTVEQGFLTLELKTQVSEKGNNVDFNFDGMFERYQKLGLYEMVTALEVAQDDDDIKGIYLRIRDPRCGWATLESLRNALIDFKAESKKPIYAYTDQMSERTLYLVSVADKIYMHEVGNFELNGLAATPTFIKGLFDKLQIKPNIFRVGKYKSPVEPLYLTKMSREDRQQVTELLDDFWSEFITPVSSYRKIPNTQFERLANDLVITNAKKAHEYKLIDQVIVESDLLDEMKKEAKLEVGDDESILIGMRSYIKRIRKEIFADQGAKNELAVLFFDGVLVDGKGKRGQIGSDDVVKEIRKIRNDSEIKGVVIRINSPGGSALSADVIWSELELLAKDKPIYASFGNIAASGGYYIAAAAEKIFASPMSVTGSIGVYGVLFNTHKFFGEKLGITYDRVVTNDYADLGSSKRDMTNQEKRVFQSEINSIYQRFLNVVQRGRNYPNSGMLEAVAQGRIWSGKSAQKMGLVDELGGLSDAIDMLADQLKLEEYSIGLYPDSEGIGAIFKQFGGVNLQDYFMSFVGIDEPILGQGVWAMSVMNWQID